MKRGCLLFLMICFAVIISSCNTNKNRPIKLKGLAQGTYYAITYYDSLDRNYANAVDSLLSVFNLTASNYHPESILSKINYSEPTELNDIFIDIFLDAQEIAEETNGYFDITVRPLVDMWGFGGSNAEDISSQKIDSVLQFVGYKKVTLTGKKIIKSDERLRLDFNPIAQGYSADWIAEFFESKGIKNYLIDIGGEVLAKGKKTNNAAWIVGIEKPAEEMSSDRKVMTKVHLINKALATSGSYRKYHIKDGVRYSHTIDPHTGYPAHHNLLSASVLADNCCKADAYATACMSMGFHKAKEFIEKSPELEAYFIVASDTSDSKYYIYATEGMKKIIEE